MAKYLQHPQEPPYLGAIVGLHIGDLGPGPGRLHVLYPCLIMDVSPFDSFYVTPLSLDERTRLLDLLPQFPNVVQHNCQSCHPNRGVNRRLWWDLIPITPDSLVVPVVVDLNPWD